MVSSGKLDAGSLKALFGAWYKRLSRQAPRVDAKPITYGDEDWQFDAPEPRKPVSVWTASKWLKVHHGRIYQLVREGKVTKYKVKSKNRGVSGKKRKAVGVILSEVREAIRLEDLARGLQPDPTIAKNRDPYGAGTVEREDRERER